MAKRLNGQRSVEVDFAMIEDGDHMYNGHLTDLYKIAGNYVISAVQRKKPQKKRRGRRRKNELTGEESDLPMISADNETEVDDETEE